jgi:hypothetical protein
MCNFNVESSKAKGNFWVSDGISVISAFEVE